MAKTDDKARMSIKIGNSGPVIDVTTEDLERLEKEFDQKMDGEPSTKITNIGGKRLISFIERIERLTTEKEALAEDIKEVYGEAKGVGFDVETIRDIVKQRKMDEEKRREKQELRKTYCESIGMQYFLF